MHSQPLLTMGVRTRSSRAKREITDRAKHWLVVPEAVTRTTQLNAYIGNSSIEPGFRHLVLLWISQINRRAYCVDLYSNDALKDGEHSQRLHCLTVWHESSPFSERERAALAYAETVTHIATTHIPNSAYADTLRQFSEREIVDLTL